MHSRSRASAPAVHGSQPPTARPSAAAEQYGPGPAIITSMGRPAGALANRLGSRGACPPQPDDRLFLDRVAGFCGGALHLRLTGEHEDYDVEGAAAAAKGRSRVIPGEISG